MTDIIDQITLVIQTNKSPWIQMMKIIEDRLSKLEILLDSNTKVLCPVTYPTSDCIAKAVKDTRKYENFLDQRRTLPHNVLLPIQEKLVLNNPNADLPRTWLAHSKSILTWLLEICVHSAAVPDATLVDFLGLEVDVATRQLEAQQQFNIGHTLYYYICSLELFGATMGDQWRIFGESGHTTVTPVAIFAKDITRSDFAKLRHFFAGSRSGNVTRTLLGTVSLVKHTDQLFSSSFHDL
ncbi:hypothetical protein INT45_004177 [Circinella minor]|uniref:Uncharacterized protein n=1 Tax=Circinella minor TaxID=1195481 RepID=A0A8H7RUR3_9FUNG|nr:hypothetical protein INT45_004177 [Circinella minor]